MSNRPLQPAGWPRPKGYSNGIAAAPGSQIVAVAGMVGWDVDEKIVPGGFAAQFEQALRNVVAVLAEAGARPEHVIRMTCYVTDIAAYRASLPEVGAAWKRTMGRTFPAMALVGVAALLEEGAVVEIEATAAIPSAR